MKYNGFEKEEHFDRFSFYNGACIMKSETIINLKKCLVITEVNQK
jgi:hypothetical protein